MRKVLQLEPITKRGRQIIKEHGDLWTVLETRDHLPCFDGRAGLFVQSRASGDTRWIEPDGSPHFTRGFDNE